jgi:hypothetical protein
VKCNVTGGENPAAYCQNTSYTIIETSENYIISNISQQSKANISLNITVPINEGAGTKESTGGAGGITIIGTMAT